MNKGFFSGLSYKYLVKSKKGFTVIELMVSLVIMVTLLTTIMANYPESTLRVNLAILTHETSLAIRETQLRGSAVDSKDLTIGGYGIFFSNNSSSSYVYFGDIATDPGPNGLSIGDGLYSTLLGADETIATTTYKKGYSISKLCLGKGYPFNGTNGGSCNSDQTSGSPIITTITISFTRPKPRSIISVNQNDLGFNPITMSNLAGTCIELVNPKGVGLGNVRSVQVYISGRIMTSNKGCQ